MKELLNIRTMIAVHLLILAGVIIVAVWVHSQQQKQITSQLLVDIDEQRLVLLSLAEVTDRNGADETVESILNDCSDRSRFEELLIALGSLNQRDLLEVQQLFEGCGDYFAVRKGFMVSRLEREYEVLRDYASIYTGLQEDTKLIGEVDAWGILVDQESARSQHMNNQVILQHEIITLLLRGLRTNSSEIIAKSNEAQETAELLSVLDKKIDEVRLGLQK